MLEWLLNPYGISREAYVILWIGLGVSAIVGVVVGIASMIRNRGRD